MSQSTSTTTSTDSSTLTSSTSVSSASTSSSASSSPSSSSSSGSSSSSVSTDTSTTSSTDSSTSTSITSTPGSSSSSSSSTSTSSPSSTSQSSTSSSSSTTALTSTATVTTTGPSGNTITFTSTEVSSPSASSTAVASHSQPKGFFQNTGAVAGTFTAVGLVGLVLLFVLVTTAIRRRRAKQFDREIAEAAAEAATAPVPVFLDDDDDNYGPGYGPNAYSTSPSGGYSDVSSHGTYGQPPMSHEGYAMSERSGPGPGPAGNFYDSNAMYGIPAAAGAAGIGVARARSVRDGGGYAAALSEGNSPYPAFATSHPQYDMYNAPPQQPMYRGPDSQEGIGMAAVGAGAAAHHYTGQSSGSDLSRMKSDGSRSLGDGYFPSTATSTTVHNGNGQQGESYASHYQPGFNDTAYQPVNHPHNLQPGIKATDPNDAYGGYMEYPATGGRTPSPAAALPNPFAAKDDESGDESEEDHGARRVLKVANN